MKLAIGIINAAAVVFLLLCLSIIIPTFTLRFYSMEYDKYSIPEKINVEKEELMKVTRHLLDYMRDKEKDLTVYADVNGENREFFNQKEKAHMVDVKNIFMSSFTYMFAALVICAISLATLARIKANIPDVLTRAYAVFIPIFMLLSGILAIIISQDFINAFNIFHEIFFTNDLWQLEPETDLLINIVPLNFFIDISVLIVIIFVTFLAVTWGGSIFVRIRTKRSAAKMSLLLNNRGNS